MARSKASMIVGSQWGDEGKGKLIDIFSAKADLVVRFQGGNNAGHTVVVGQDEYILHLIPSGIVQQHPKCLIGNGVVLNPHSLIKELDYLHERNIDTKGRLFISENVQLIMPYHMSLDVAAEKLKGELKIGTTGRGIGPAYVDKVARIGIRLSDLWQEEYFIAKVRHNVELKNNILRKLYDAEGFDADRVIHSYLQMGKRLKPYAVNGPLMVEEHLAAGKNVLFEGAQGTLLDVDHGTYPFVTSSNPTAGGACTGAGVGPTAIGEVVGIVKAYTTRVGEGPFPTEFSADLDEKMRLKGKEYGATTGRPRRCGWLDTVVLRHSVRVNGLTGIALTKLDVLSGTEKIKICDAYRLNGQSLNEYPSSIDVFEKVEPVYHEVPGFKEDISGCSTWDDLPSNAAKYIEHVQDLLKTPINIVSVGPKRSQTLYR